MGVVAVFCDLPIAVVGVVAVAKAGIAANAVFQQEGAHLHSGIDGKAVLGKVGLAGLNALHRKEGAAVYTVDEITADGADQLQGVAAAVKMERDAGFLQPQGAGFDHFLLIVHELPGGILADAQPEVFALILPKPHIGGDRLLRFGHPGHMEAGILRLIDIALLRVPQPEHGGIAHVLMADLHQHIAFPVPVLIVEGDLEGAAADVLDSFGKSHAVKQHLLLLIPVEGGAVGVGGHQHIHAVPIMGDGAAADYHAGGAPVLSRCIAGIAAGGKAKAKRQRQRKGNDLLPSNFHHFPVLSITPSGSKSPRRPTREHPRPAQRPCTTRRRT